MQDNLCRSVGHLVRGHMDIVALFLGYSNYISDTKEYYILVMFPSFSGFPKHKSKCSLAFTEQNPLLHSFAIRLTDIFLYLLQVSTNFPTIPCGSNSVCKCCQLLTLQ